LLFFLHNSATSEIYTLSLHDALPISIGLAVRVSQAKRVTDRMMVAAAEALGNFSPDNVNTETKLLPPIESMRDVTIQIGGNSFVDRKSTRLNSSHVSISYAVFCLKKK